MNKVMIKMYLKLYCLMFSVLILILLTFLRVTNASAQESLHAEWDGFQRSQPSVQDNDAYFAQNGRNNISILQTSVESRVAVFSFDLSGLSEKANNFQLKLYNISTNSIQNPNLVLYAKQHDLASNVAPTWAKLNLSSSFGDEVLTKTITDDDQNKWMVISSSKLTEKINEARGAGMKLALILAYPEGVTDGASIKFENSNAFNDTSSEFDTSGEMIKPPKTSNL